VPPRPKVTPLAAERFALTLTMSQDMYDKLAHAKDLLAHQLPSGDIVQVLDRALDALIEKLEKRKFGRADKPRESHPRESKNLPYIPARVRHAVHERDGGRCTFVAENGHRCEARKFLEFDHVLEVARGGQSTVENLRLRCRAHNQYTAEQTYGPDLMEAKREEARRAAAKKRAEEVIPYLQALGIRAEKARHASERCPDMPDASLEDRVEAALGCFAAKPSRPEARQPIMSV
jgi:5-methylcytosine-specific restriction endonuclease McrA